MAKSIWGRGLLLLLFSASLLIAATGVRAAIALDATGRAAIFYDVTQQTGQALSWTHTTGAGANRLLIVGISTYSSAAAPVVPRVSSVTYDGQTLVRIGPLGDQATVAPDNRTAVEMFYLDNAGLTAATNSTITVNFNPATPLQYAVGGSVTFTGVNQTTPFAAQPSTNNFAEASGTSSTASVTVTSAPGQLVLDTIAAEPAATFFGPDASQTRLWYENPGDLTPPFNSFDIGGGSSKPGTSATVTMSWTLNNSAAWGLRAVSIQPFITSAAMVSIGGTVRMSSGAPVRGAVVKINTTNGTRSTTTNSYGRYSFEKIPAGQTVLLSAVARGLVFPPRTVTVRTEARGVDLTSVP
jgi:hypothetical protein